MENYEKQKKKTLNKQKTKTLKKHTQDNTKQKKGKIEREKRLPYQPTHFSE